MQAEKAKGFVDPEMTDRINKAIKERYKTKAKFAAIIGVAAIPTPPKNKEDARKELISKNFSPWDGAHRGLEAYIKNAMHDPKSYEHVATRYWDRGDYLVVQTEFRGKNAFGGVVKNYVKAKVGLGGEVLEIMDEN